MTDLTLESLAERVSRLERQDKTVEARGLLLHDTEGNRRAALSLDEHGQPSILFCDAEGHLRAGLDLVVEEGRLRLSLLDADGKTRAILVVAEGGLGLFDTEDNARALWRLGEDR